MWQAYNQQPVHDLTLAVTAPTLQAAPTVSATNGASLQILMETTLVQPVAAGSAIMSCILAVLLSSGLKGDIQQSSQMPMDTVLW